MNFAPSEIPQDTPPATWGGHPTPQDASPATWEGHPTPQDASPEEWRRGLAEQAQMTLNTFVDIQGQPGMNSPLPPNDPELRALVLGAALHELWLRTRLVRDDGQTNEYKPRVKETTDNRWIELHGTSKIDIANTFFLALPEDWRRENFEAAKVIDSLVMQAGGAEKINLNDPGTYSRVGSHIHAEWLKRNTYAKGSPLDVPFDALREEEKEKDIAQLRFVLQLLTPNAPKSEPKRNRLTRWRRRSDSPEQYAADRFWFTKVWQSMNNWALERNLPIRGIDGSRHYPGDPYYDDQKLRLTQGYR